MAGTSLLALLDDITSVLDDVATLTKVATHKTAGVLGDDLALNAQQVTGVRADRELPVVWAVAKGSLVNKAILVPAALTISALAPWGVTPLLMVGGTYLCFEGFEKVLHARGHKDRESSPSEEARHLPEAEALTTDLGTIERAKIRGAVRTDFVLSAEIVTIALGSVREAAFTTQILALTAIGIVMTAGVYGLVAAIVKLDDLGLLLTTRASKSNPTGFDKVQGSLGSGILRLAPWFMKVLSIVGTVAMFLVGGQILVHGIPWMQRSVHHLATAASGSASLLSGAITAASSAAFGVFAGTLVYFCVIAARRALGRR